MRGPRRATPPRWATPAALVGLVAAAAGILALALVRLVVGGTSWRPGLLVALVAAAGGAAAAGLLSARLTAALEQLRGDAVARLQQPDRPAGRASRRSPPEVAELGRVLEALQLRVRVGDAVAERHRQTAEAAGAGMGELLSGLVAAEEGARGQLAAELHDTVAQSLLAARALLPGLDAGEAADLVEEAEEQVRAVMARTRPPELRRGDLASAVGAACADVHRRYGLTVSLSWPSEPHPLPVSSAVVVYRFFQEALLNVVKHADGDQAAASLVVDGDGLRAEVADEGPGFDPGLGAGKGGRQVGLALLRERARLAGGGVEVLSSPGGRTRVRLHLPPLALTGAVTSPWVAPRPRPVSAAGAAPPPV